MKKSKDKKFILRFCPKCNSEDIIITVGTKKGEWQCKKCSYKGNNFIEKKVSEEGFLKEFGGKNG